MAIPQFRSGSSNGRLVTSRASERWGRGQPTCRVTPDGDIGQSPPRRRWAGTPDYERKPASRTRREVQSSGPASWALHAGCHVSASAWGVRACSWTRWPQGSRGDDELRECIAPNRQEVRGEETRSEGPCHFGEARPGRWIGRRERVTLSASLSEKVARHFPRGRRRPGAWGSVGRKRRLYGPLDLVTVSMGVSGEESQTLAQKA